MDVIKWLRQRFCKHKYRKHWSKERQQYEMRCVKCNKITPAQTEVKAYEYEF